jgi:hypothetical protein
MENAKANARERAPTALRVLYAIPDYLDLRLEIYLLKLLHAFHVHLVESLGSLIIEDTGALHEGLLVLDKESGIGWIDLRMKACIHPDSVDWARLNAVSTVDTEKGVDLVPLRELLNGWIFVFTRFDINTSSWTRRRAEEARGTLHISISIERETMPSTIAGGIRSTLIGVLNGDTGTFLKLHAKKFKRMKPQVLEQSSVGDRETFEDLNYVDPLKK